jgi:hypothetical protein
MTEQAPEPEDGQLHDEGAGPDPEDGDDKDQGDEQPVAF